MPTPTIVEIQAAIDAKADARQIINMIADYIQANPGGGGVTLYSGNAPIASDRTVDLNGKVLQFTQGGNPWLRIDPTGTDPSASLSVTSPDGFNAGLVNPGASDTYGTLLLVAGYHSETATINLFADATSSTLSYTADTHTFNGVINLPLHANPTPQDGDVWRVDNTNTGLKIRINGVTKTITVS